MRVVCIADHFTGDPGPKPTFGRILTVKRRILDMGESMYIFKEFPDYAYETKGFLILESSLPKKRKFRAPKGGLFEK
jgi:hypothetical protein